MTRKHHEGTVVVVAAAVPAAFYYLGLAIAKIKKVRRGSAQR